MFTLAELEEDPAAILDIKEDIREECAKLGDVTNVVLYDKEPDGVASVRFSTPEAAAACVRVSSPLSLAPFTPSFTFFLLPSFLSPPKSIFLILSARPLLTNQQFLNGRFFSGTTIEASISTGRERFKKSNEKRLGVEVDEQEGIEKTVSAGGGGRGGRDEESERLDKFGNWLEGEGGKG